MHHDVTMNQEANEFFKAASKDASYRQMGVDSGLSYSTIRRQLSGEGELTAHLVVGLARTYGQDVLKALAVSGFITDEEAGLPGITEALHRASDMELASEILRRAKDGTASRALTGPLSSVEESDVSGREDNIEAQYQRDQALAAKKRSKNRGEVNYD